MAGSSEPIDVAAMLSAWRAGNQDAGNELIGVVYLELRRLAAHYLNSERPNHTLQATELVHELYLKLFSNEPVQLQDREHFLALAARQLRHIIVDYARSKQAQKRGGSQGTISINDALPSAIPTDQRVVDLDDALRRLETLDARAAHVVELRFFGGLTDEEVARTLSISPATVKRDWDFARSWLSSQML